MTTTHLNKAGEQTRGTLSFDGCGINGPDEYRTRLATFGDSISGPERKHYGNLFAVAPELLQACQSLVEWSKRIPVQIGQCKVDLAADLDSAQIAIAKAENRS